MAVTITVRLAEAEADALLKVADRGGWHSKPSIALQVADMKIIGAIAAARAEATVSRNATGLVPEFDGERRNPVGADRHTFGNPEVLDGGKSFTSSILEPDERHQT